MVTFDETLMEADRIVKRLGNIANRPDLRLAQTLQLLDILFLVYRNSTDKDFGLKLKELLLSYKEKEMNKPMKSYYITQFIADVDKMLGGIS